MFLSFNTISLLCAGAAIVWFWQDSLRARDVANVAAMAACERIGLQFLDGTVAFAQLRFVRDGGGLRLRRTYVFDYTSQSIERRQGFAILLGKRVEYVGFAPEHTAQATPAPFPEQRFEPPSSAEKPKAPLSVAGNVFDFCAHRTQRATPTDVTPKRD